MSTESYDRELRSERARVAALYERLDAERARAAAGHDAALRDVSSPLLDRDVRIRSTGEELRRVRGADDGLCFGRMDDDAGDSSYIGRIGLLDERDEFRPVLLDWRAPAARPFYTATAVNPEGMRRRRHFQTRGRRVVGFTDQPLGGPPGDATPGAGSGDAALLAALNAPRGTAMRDIVATIQREQDAIIRLDHPGVLVIEGGPGTGKTVVALHRVAYLLYTHRERMARHGALVVGPNPAFLEHVRSVLPSLGETNVVYATAGGLYPGLLASAEDAPDAARAKGALAMLDVLAAAIADRQRGPERPIAIELSDVTVPIDDDIAGWARDEARASGLPHNDARAVFVDVLTWALVERAVGRIGAGWLSRTDRDVWRELAAEVRAELVGHDGFAAALDELWPVLTPESLLAALYESPQRLRAAGADPSLWRADGAAWTVSDVPLLDELVDLLGGARRDGESNSDTDAAGYAAGVLEVLHVERRDDLMDDEDHLLAQDLIGADELAERFASRDSASLAERAAADREWTYRHVVVDEAQELSEMDWRVLMRRCPSRSFTIVGDLAQRRSPAGATSWAAMLDRYVPGRWAYRSLSVNYRTPAEIMSVAAAVLGEFAPDAVVPESVRATGVRPWFRRVGDGELDAAIAAFAREERGRDGTVAVIGPPDVAGAVAPARTKGLEFDAVLVVDPERILDGSARGAAELYVALTRATQRLGVLHRGPLPPALAGSPA